MLFVASDKYPPTRGPAAWPPTMPGFFGVRSFATATCYRISAFGSLSEELNYGPAHSFLPGKYSGLFASSLAAVDRNQEVMKRRDLIIQYGSEV